VRAEPNGGFGRPVFGYPARSLAILIFGGLRAT
jgi:hypothetical protein